MKMFSIRKSRAFKCTAIFLAASIIAEIVAPSLYAASQPELEGFKPIGANNMVDPFTGDFSYNLPLMHVPGPGGGYPINMAYQSGVTMTQEASWVGLGWSLNVGTVNRQVRGLPDEFNGDQTIEKTQYTKPNRTVSVDLGAKWSEIFGADLDKLDLNISANAIINYNNYRGFSIVPGLGLEFAANQQLRSRAQKSEVSGEAVEENPDTTCVSVGEIDQINAQDAVVKQEKFKKWLTKNYDDIAKGYNQYLSAGMSFNNLNSAANFITLPRTSTTTSFTGKLGGVFAGTTGDINFKAAYTESSIIRTTRTFSAFGFNYLERGKNKGGASILDFQRAHEGVLNPTTQMLPMPIATYDMFFVNAQGLGGSMRGYRNDIPMLSDPSFYDYSGSAGYGVDADFGGTELKVGGSVDIINTESRSGGWSDAPDGISDIYFGESPINNALYETVAYKFSDETTADSWAFAQNNDHAQKLNLKAQHFDGAFKPNISNQLGTSSGNEGNLSNNYAYRPERNKRVKNVQFFTQGELYELYGPTAFGRTTGAGGTDAFKYGADMSSPDPQKEIFDSHIGEIQITQGSGVRYKFGIPAYTRVQEEVVYATSFPEYENPLNQKNQVAFDVTQDKVGNGQGMDEYYSKTRTPIHPHAFLLTEILSEDYIDVSGDGPTIDDLGDYVKFSYERKYENFKTRDVIGGKSNYNPGQLSNPDDDKASFVYSEKDIYYTEEIRTKTHVAVFTRSSILRLDGKEVHRDGSLGSKQLEKLDKIELFKLDKFGNLEVTPIKTVHFEYEDNPSDAIKGGGANSANGTRLTLKRVYFSYGDQTVSKTKSNLSSYQFGYDLGEDYDLSQVDRWGNYQSDDDNPLGKKNVLHPYTQQNSKSAADASASKWNLTSITLPSGATYTITYESDDYQYVQNQKATRMFELLGFSNVPSGTEPQYDLGEDYKYLLFKLDESTNVTDDICDYIKGQKEIYFKVLTKLKTSSGHSVVDEFDIGGNVADYVDGYAVPESCGIFNPTKKIGYIKIKNVNVPGITGEFHPVRLAAINYLRMNRPDLVSLISGFNFSAAIDLGAVSSMVNGMVNDVLGELKEGTYIGRSEARGYASEMYGDDDPNFALKSIVRLNEVDGIKFGGGSRVRSIMINDNWSEMTNSEEPSAGYETVYEYRLKDGTSSGVASWEPALGNEENSLIQPLRSSSALNMFFKDNAYIQELPIGHTLYPAPKVGYSRVVSYQNNNNDSPREYGTGIQEFEYYTAYDYPFYGERTNIQRFLESPSKSFMAFIGVKFYQFDGYSQGYAVHLNDMHGKMKSSSTYESSKRDNLVSPVTRTEYYYHTLGGYKAGKSNVLNSLLPVLTGDAQTNFKTIGKEVDMCLDFRESTTETESIGINTNLSVMAAILTIPSIFPGIANNLTGTRTAVFSKVITQTAVLDYIKVEQNGAVAITQNEYFDTETGEALLTSVNNEFGDRIYNYQFPGHWYYNALKGAYNNIGYIFEADVTGNIDAATQGILVSGDVLMETDGSGELYWVKKNAGVFSFVDQYNNLPSPILSPGAKYKIIQSGYDNMQTAKVGSLTAMVNPVDPNLLNDAILDNVNQKTDISVGRNDFQVINCLNGNEIDPGSWNVYAGIIDVDFPNVLAGILPDFPGRKALVIENTAQLETCPRIVLFPEEFDGNVEDYLEYKKISSTQVEAINQIDGSVVICEFFAGECDYRPCINGVINATAIKYQDNIPRPNNEFGNGLTASMAAANPYRYGQLGIWRPTENYAFFKARKQIDGGTQLETRIQEDGTYDGLNLFDWTAGSSANWRNAQTITKQDVLGNSIEIQNTLGIKSSSMYGFCSDLMVAQAQNAAYDEIAFKSFEDEDLGCPGAQGHITYQNEQGIVDGPAHTGSMSLELGSSIATTITFDLTLQDGQAYVIRYWKKEGTTNLQLSAGQDPSQAPVMRQVSGVIDGWMQMEIFFKYKNAEASGNPPTLPVLTATSGAYQYIDDLRLHPADGAMVTYVFDQNTMLLAATLDDNNFAKVYLYDNEQNLEQVKIETQEGIQTVQLNQTHYKQD